MVVKKRKTNETDVSLKLELFGSGKCAVKTGIGFFDHMIASLAKHALIDLELECEGDLIVDGHHTVEDVGIALGSALNEAIFPASGIERFADRIAILDEAAAQCAIDVSGRAFFSWEVPSLEGKIGEFDGELAEEFFRALVANAKISAHISLIRGSNRHHIAEAIFKAFALAFRSAIAPNERVVGVPSLKGAL
ncbi:MAG: imidazoleglycerol-phosphate dehydratase HisB [Helicobacteraceae bacterium]|jgi:imidazoleglycerol-phosphate dehydratase|nr:imidazoleglycerol-phosphate dehydratase HisB [Helicobacteraceae bacterium]